MISLRLLTALNVAYDDAELLDVIERLAIEIENGNLAADVDLDAIESLHLTDAGRAALKPLPWTSA